MPAADSNTQLTRLKYFENQRRFFNLTMTCALAVMPMLLVTYANKNRRRILHTHIHAVLRGTTLRERYYIYIEPVIFAQILCFSFPFREYLIEWCNTRFCPRKSITNENNVFANTAYCKIESPSSVIGSTVKINALTFG